MTDMEDRVLAIMKEEGRPLKAGDIAELAGEDKRQVDKAMASLKKTGAIVSPQRYFWEPSE